MTDEELKGLVASLAAGHKEIQEQQKQTDVQLAKTDVQSAKTDVQSAKRDIHLDRLQKNIDQLTKHLDDMGYIDVAEDLFRSNIAHLLEKRGMPVDSVETNLKMSNSSQYDIVAVNKEKAKAVVLEVKDKLKPKHIQHFLKTRLPRFKRDFPMFAAYTIYGAVGSLVVPEQLERQAEKAGLFVFTQTRDGGAGIANEANFRAKVF